jgi:hypothetical protein
MINALASRIWRHDTFHAEYRSLLRANLATSLGVGDASDGLSDAAIWRLLQSATHLSGVTEIPEGSAMRAAAYRIAVSAWRLYRQRFDNLGKVLHFVLGRLGNFPAIGYLSQTQDDDRQITLPDLLWLEVTAHAIENRVEVTQTESITLTDFQWRLWMALEAGTPTAVTAPTSAGKSFVLQHFLVAAVLSAPGQWGLYVVPTRALITQVSSELMRLFKDLAPEREVQVLTIPLPPETLGVSNGVYVLTQERTQILLESGIELPFRLAIIDEAHNIGEGARGVVLQTVIEKLQRNEESVRFLFGCPQTGNLQVFQRVFAFDRLESITERDSPVAQNLIFLNTNSEDPASVSVGAIIDGETTPIGTLNMGVPVVGKPEQRLATISWAVGKHDQNLVYIGGPAKCEVVSDLLRQFAVSEGNGAVNVDVHQRREEFAAFLREHIHPQYLLAATVLAGVGFHYGNMPSTVRKTLEEYFGSGDLSYLACTTTLLAGVNLPAKNLFLMDPTKGSEFATQKEQAISATDFWNLAGRAGRLGKDFEGNVFLIDHARWRADPLAGPREQEVASAVEEAVVTRGTDFLQFVRNRDHPSGREPAFENTFVKLVNHARRGELTDQLSRVFRDTKPSLRAEIHRVIEEAAERAELPQEVAERNINVSIYR